MPKTAPVKWTREHFLIALNLYCKLPFGKLHKSNPIIVEAAAKMGRSPSSLSMKLCNFASLDPVQKARGIRGLEGATKQDRAIWNEFQSGNSELREASEQLIHDLFTQNDNEELDFLTGNKIEVISTSGPTESQASVKVRRGQQFFRQSILNAYDLRCCVSGINIPEFLVASHIKPWSSFPEDRLNPQNGLCLSRIHDAAFDSGLMTLDCKFRVVLSKRLKSFLPQHSLEQNFMSFEGMPIQFPHKLAEPSSDCIRFHREQIFQS